MLYTLFVVFSIVAFSVFALSVLFGGKYPVLKIVNDYVVRPLFWVFLIYFFIRVYSLHASKQGRYFILTLITYAFFVLMLVSFYLFSVHGKIISLVLDLVSGLALSCRILVLIAVNVILAFSITALSCLVAEIFLSYLLSKIVTLICDRCVVFVLRGQRYSGFAVGGLFRGFAFVFTPSGELDDVGEAILVHECQHVRGRHTYHICSLIVSYLLTVWTLQYIHGVEIYAYIAYAPFMALLPIVLFRVMEVHADLAMFRRYGSKALDYLIRVLKSLYNVDSPDKAPYFSRILHTARRDLVLKFGDAIAPHAPWEFPLVISLLAAGIFTSRFIQFIESNPYVKFIIKLHSINYVYLIALQYLIYVIGVFIISILLGLVFKPVVKIFLTGLLTEKGIINVSMLISSLYVVTTALESIFNTIPYLAPAVASLVNFFIVIHYVSDIRRAICVSLLSLAIFVAISVLFALIFSNLTKPLIANTL